MSIYDVKIESLKDLPPLAGAVVVSDCDETLFEHGTTTLFPDVEEALVGIGHLALVSANPDANLMSKRQDLLNASTGLAAHKPIWYKGRLFQEVAQELSEVTDSVVIMGDRSIADVGIAKHIFERRGFDTLGVRVARPNIPVSVRADYILRSGFSICSAFIKLAKQDDRFRPRDEDGQRIAESFLARGQ